MSVREEIVRTARKVEGNVSVPSDKSITHRALLLASLAKGKTRVSHPLRAQDILSTLACLKILGVRVEEEGEDWIVEGKGLWGFRKPARDLPCGNSGTTMRLLSGILAGQGFESRLVGDASLSCRPMKRVVEPLNQMGAHVLARDNEYAPLIIQGRKPLSAIEWTSPVASAQVKSCLLLAGLHADGVGVFREPHLSRDHTEKMLLACGVPLKIGRGQIELRGPYEPAPQDWDVPGDPSSAAFFLAAAALLPGSKVRIVNISVNETRIGFIKVLQAMGADVQWEAEGARQGAELVGHAFARGGSVLWGTVIGEGEVVGMIDEVPLLAVVATQARGRTLITGASELRFKESDRLGILCQELKKMGARIQELPGGLSIEGPTPLVGAVVDSHGDHRLAMALAVAGLVAQDETRIVDAGCVDISFPGFWEKLGLLLR